MEESPFGFPRQKQWMEGFEAANRGGDRRDSFHELLNRRAWIFEGGFDAKENRCASHIFETAQLLPHSFVPWPPAEPGSQFARSRRAAQLEALTFPAREPNHCTLPRSAARKFCHTYRVPAPWRGIQTFSPKILSLCAGDHAGDADP